MFQDKKLREVKKELWESILEVNRKKVNKDDLVECDTCGCLIYRDRAVSKKVIEERKKQEGGFYVGAEGFMSSRPIEEVAEEVCITKYFCRRCGRKFAKNKVKNEKKN